MTHSSPGSAKHPRIPVDAIISLVNHQQQCDQDGVMVQVSRRALAEVLVYVTEVRPDNKWADIGAPAQAAGEPVAWQIMDKHGRWITMPGDWSEKENVKGYTYRPLYAEAPAGPHAVDVLRSVRAEINLSKAPKLAAKIDDALASVMSTPPQPVPAAEEFAKLAESHVQMYPDNPSYDEACRDIAKAIRDAAPGTLPQTASLREALQEAIDVFDGMNDDEINEELLPRLRAALSRPE